MQGWKNEMPVHRLNRHLIFWVLEPLQDALLPAAGRRLRFDGKPGIPRGQRCYHEVKRERADGRGGASQWAARGTGLALDSAGDAAETLKTYKNTLY